MLLDENAFNQIILFRRKASSIDYFVYSFVRIRMCMFSWYVFMYVRWLLARLAPITPRSTGTWQGTSNWEHDLYEGVWAKHSESSDILQ